MNSVIIKGEVSRRPYSSERFAAFSVRPAKVGVDDRAPNIDVVCFDAGVVATAGMLAEGDAIEVRGHLGVKKLTDKSKAAVQIDGRDIWIMQLVADEIDSGAQKKTDEEF